VWYTAWQVVPCDSQDSLHTARIALEQQIVPECKLGRTSAPRR
jgi:hypothetical protein